VVAQLTTEQELIRREVLDQLRAEIGQELRLDPAAAAQAEREAAEKAAYDAAIAERDARCLADPEWVAAQAEERRRVELANQRKIEELRAWSKRDVRAETAARAGGGQASPAFRCHICGVWMYEGRSVRGGVDVCYACFGARSLRCDKCDTHKNVVTHWCDDELWRCDPCAAEFKANPPARKPGRDDWS
jgi:hypothetical protein